MSEKILDIKDPLQAFEEDFLGDLANHGHFGDAILLEGLDDLVQFGDVDFIISICFGSQFRFDITDDGDDDDFVTQLFGSAHKFYRQFADTGKQSYFFHSNHPYS